MRMGSWFAGVAVASAVLGACVTPSEPTAPEVALGGTSHLVDVFDRVGRDAAIPPELLAAISYVETRLQFVTTADHGATAIGLLGLSTENLAYGAELAGVTDEAARTDAEASLRAGAALLRAQAPEARTLRDFLDVLEPNLRSEVIAVLARGIDGQDANGGSIVVAARPYLDHNAGYGTTIQALDSADYGPAKWVAASTANYAVGSRGLTEITHVVIHTMQGSYNGTISWFKDPAAQVSAHYNLRSSDGEITQMVKEKDVAWHDACFNKNTVGIEHEGYVTDPDRWYTTTMYAESAKLAAYLADKYNIPKTHGRILGHGEAPDCSDHTDPGAGWNWDEYIALVATGGAPMFGAADVTVDAPAELTAGERATVTITVTNNGNTAWDLDLTRLGTTVPHDRASPFFVAGDWTGPTRATGADARVDPGATGTFTFEIVAPSVRDTTTYDEAFQLVQEGVAWFGPEVHVVVRVVPDDGGCSAGAGTGSTTTACSLILLGVLAARRRRRSRRGR